MVIAMKMMYTSEVAEADSLTRAVAHFLAPAGFELRTSLAQD